MSNLDTTSGSYRIEPLKGPENWLSFQVQIQDILTDTGYMEYVDGTNLRPSDKPLQPDWDKKDRKALTIIRLRVSPSIIMYIMSATTSKQAWDTLKGVFNAQGALAKITTRRKFLRYSIEDGSNMEAEVRNIRMIKEELALLGITVEDEEFGLTILTALPASWDSFISSIGTTELKSNELIGRIFQEDAHRQERSSEIALVARPAQTRSKFRKGVICHHCRKEGHIKPECRSRQNQQAGGNQQFGAAPASYQHNQAHVATSQDFHEEYAFLSIEDIPEVAALIAKGEPWLADTACQRHIIGDRTLFTNYTHTDSEIKGVGTCRALGQGDVCILFKTEKGDVPITLKNALHAPDLEYNLISLGRLTSNGLTFSGAGEKMTINDHGRIIGRGRKVANLYHMDVQEPITRALPATFSTARSWYEWHCALGHVNQKQLIEMYNNKLVDGMEVDLSSPKDFSCDSCIKAKHARNPIPDSTEQRDLKAGDLTVSDIWGPARTESFQCNTYVITFTDIGTRHSSVYFMKSRAAALDRFKQYEQMFETQFGRRLKVLHVDNAKEYTQGDFKKHLDDHGVILRTTAPYSPAQNGVAEHLNRTLVERVRAMIFQHNSPLFLWQEAIAYANYLRNHTPTRSLNGITPHEAFWGRRPDIKATQDFGSPCWVLVPDSRQSKLTPKSEKHTFVGISDHSAGWRYYDAGMRHILISRNVIFPKPASTTTPDDPSLEGEQLESAPAETAKSDLIETSPRPARTTSCGYLPPRVI